MQKGSKKIIGLIYLVLFVFFCKNNFFFDKPYRLIRPAPGGTHLVLQSGLTRKRTTLPSPNLEYLPTNAKG